MDTTLADIGSPTVGDNCGSPTFTYVDDLSGLTGCNGTGTFTRTFTVDDGCGNLSTCTQTVTVEDNTVPTVTCPADATVEFDGVCALDTTLADIGSPTVGDNCGSPTFTYVDDLSGLTGCNGTGTFTRTFTVDDGCGNLSTCTQTVTVEDNTVPTVTCPADATVEFDGLCALDTTLADIGSPTVGDNCGSPTFTYVDDLSGLTGCNGTGTFTRTFTVDDGCGNLSTCTQTVTVEDNTVPTVTCPADATVEFDGVCALDTTLADIGSPTVGDNCGSPTFTYVDDLSGLTGCNGTGTFTRTFTVDDGCGNLSTCTQTVTVEDNTVPTVTCPADRQSDGRR